MSSELRDDRAATPQPAPDAGAAGTGGAPGDGAAAGLPAREREMLAFERQWWRFAGAKEEAIRERFGMSATRYYQVLNALVDRPEALATDPLLVRRLRRMRGARQRQRSGRVLGSDPLRD
ncbi:DUF3263 domain-containing protein [Modestobacter altitudinis]|uniref:DUF3263 domain-containing protein n=1 Tax=Modestobacter altitudinis TaxID=2213158 RepID=UPI00110CB660|nr:DUF3263 domain-containing protein [Modestobacter altitudinis]